MPDLIDMMEQEPERHSPIFAAYLEWDKANPEFYPLFKRYSKQLADKGHRNIGVALIFERIRWQSYVRFAPGEGGYQLNNNFRSIYARRFMRENPEFEGFFRTRELRAIRDGEADSA